MTDISAQDPAAPRANHLDGLRIIKTLDHLHQRISARFPHSGLSGVCAELAATARLTETRAAGLAKPYLALRCALGLVIFVAIVAVVLMTTHLHLEGVARADPVSLTQGLESLVNLLALAGAAVWFLLTVETRLKRRLAHTALSELRAFAHVIDMYQLTKDPTVVVGGGPQTSVSPKRDMSQFELARYLDYCAEMLALIAKLAALYERAHADPEISAAANGVETLTSDLGRKIWQKITIIGQLAEVPRS